MRLNFCAPDGANFAVQTTACLIAGWTGRDMAKVTEHIEELAAIGVPRPSSTPLYYRVPAALLTQAGRLEALGEKTGGEAEPIIVDDGKRLWLGLGSDHTDRALEAVSVAHAKTVCGKPMAGELWPLDSVAERLDDMRLTSEISLDGHNWTPYQDGTLAQIRPLASLIAGAPTAHQDRLEPGVVMFCGTVPAIGGVRATPWFRAALDDPQSGRRLTLAYQVDALPVID